MKRGIIFDMDGTLWDSAENVAKSWNVAIRQYGVREKELTTQDIQGVMGKTMDVIADILFAEFPEEKRRLLLKECCQVENDYLREHGGILYDQVPQTLAALKRDGYHLSIVSNCQIPDRPFPAKKYIPPIPTHRMDTRPVDRPPPTLRIKIYNRNTKTNNLFTIQDNLLINF